MFSFYQRMPIWEYVVGKDSDAGKYWGQEEKRGTENAGCVDTLDMSLSRLQERVDGREACCANHRVMSDAFLHLCIGGWAYSSWLSSLSLAKFCVFSALFFLGGEGRYSFILFYGSFFPLLHVFPPFVFSLSLPRLLKVLLFYPFYCEKHSFLGLPAWILHTSMSLPWTQCADLLGPFPQNF